MGNNGETWMLLMAASHVAELSHARSPALLPFY